MSRWPLPEVFNRPRFTTLATLSMLVMSCIAAYTTCYSSSPSASYSSTGSALILYDAPAEEPKLGLSYAIMLQSLLGHFEIQTDVQPVGNYLPGQMSAYRTVFYLGSYYNTTLPDAFLKDAANVTDQPEQRMVWFKYNLWQITQPKELGFEDKSGLSFLGLHGLDAEPTDREPNPGFYDTVEYKGKALVKYYDYDEATHTPQADPDIGIVAINNRKNAQTRVTIRNSRTDEKTPYIVQAGPFGNFWYFADLPLSYIGPRDRYLVLCDILHDILEIQHPENHLALVRLEDVSAKVEYSSMKKLVDYLHSLKIPFSVATIPHYKDPLGVGNDGTPEDIPFARAIELRRALFYATQAGGSIVMHGYTHQYDSMKNPNTGISADDFEFWNAVAQSPVAEDSEKWALNRLNAGITDLSLFGFLPWAWETPHYQGSPLAYLAMAKRFTTTYQRVVYYSALHPDLHAASPKRDYAAGMFFPYIISKDAYGQRVIPENLGNIEYDIHDIDPSSNIVYTWKDLLENAEDALVVRDGYASFFFHPFWLDPGFEQLNAFEDFKRVITGITRLGFRWSDGQSLATLPNVGRHSEPNTPLDHQRESLRDTATQ